jgi:hypothetical protein
MEYPLLIDPYPPPAALKHPNAHTGRRGDKHNFNDRICFLNFISEEHHR